MKRFKRVISAFMITILVVTAGALTPAVYAEAYNHNFDSSDGSVYVDYTNALVDIFDVSYTAENGKVTGTSGKDISEGLNALDFKLKSLGVKRSNGSDSGDYWDWLYQTLTGNTVTQIAKAKAYCDGAATKDQKLFIESSMGGAEGGYNKAATWFIDNASTIKALLNDCSGLTEVPAFLRVPGYDYGEEEAPTVTPSPTVAPTLEPVVWPELPTPSPSVSPSASPKPGASPLPSVSPTSRMVDYVGGVRILGTDYPFEGSKDAPGASFVNSESSFVPFSEITLSSGEAFTGDLDAFYSSTTLVDGMSAANVYERFALAVAMNGHVSVGTHTTNVKQQDCGACVSDYGKQIHETSYNVDGVDIALKTNSFKEEFNTLGVTDYSAAAFGPAALNHISGQKEWFENEISDFEQFKHNWCYSSIYDVIYEYGLYATQLRAEWNKQAGLTDGAKAVLPQLCAIHDAYASYYPILTTLWEYTVGDEKSLKQLFEESDTPASKGSPSIFDDTFFVENEPGLSPLTLFYTLNSTNGISSIDKMSIWNDIEVDTSGSTLVEEHTDYYYGVEDNVNKTESVEEYDNITSGNVVTMSGLSEMALGYDSEGKATSAKVVTMSDYIVEGMMYSSTFVPMKTNLYSPDTLSQFEQKFRDEFYYKYGFMRKALLWDKSGTSVMDYYNAGNKLTNTLEVITLRDLLESDGNDISLYVDDDFYNAEEALTEANELLDIRTVNNRGLSDYLIDYYNTAEFLAMWSKQVKSESTAGDIIAAADIDISFLGRLSNLFLSDEKEVSVDDIHKAQAIASSLKEELETKYSFNLTAMTAEQCFEYATKLSEAASMSDPIDLTEESIKTGDYGVYSNKLQAYLKRCEDVEYRYVDDGGYINGDNLDTLVLPSSLITSYMDATSSYQAEIELDETSKIINTYVSYDSYTPMLGMSYVSALYREANYFSLANLVSGNNPIFLASDDLCGLENAEQWYVNTVINYALVQNLRSSAQIDFTYTTDLDCPLYVDVFGNILTESGIVVIPAASNMTLHNASYKDSNVALGLYACYGNNYFVPMSCEGAANALFPFFVLDPNEEVYIIQGNSISFGEGKQVTFNALAPYDTGTQEAIMHAYKSYVKEGAYTNLNWVALVNICNEVMRGAPIENIDKDIEGLHVNVTRNKAAIVAAVKLEELIKSFTGTMSNTLLSIPDFSRMDDVEYLVAFLIKMLIVSTAAVIIIAIYRDGVSGQLGLRTFWKSTTSIALAFSAVCLVPAIFQLTYYGANKFLLQDEAFRILMLNEEKYNSGVEIGMLDTTVPSSTADMAIQLDWISVPWYDQLDNMLYGSTLQNLGETKRDAYLQSPIYDNYDVTLYNDGVYTTTEQLFDSVHIDYSFSAESANERGLWLYANNSLQTASFYSPYYAFLNILTANVNEYNYNHNTYNYTTKYMSGNRLKTVGLCNPYFTSLSFMELDNDIMHMCEIYGSTIPDTYDHGLLFTAQELDQFAASGWYARYPDDTLQRRVDLMNQYARDFVADNKDLMTKVTDETFLKVMALSLAIKHNQLFGIPYANALEIYNMDSYDLLRLSIAPTEDAILSSPMSFSRFVYNYGGEPAVYAAAVLVVIVWLGSFIKPICTVITFVSVFASIYVFRVVLRKPSANLWGYLVTSVLLCFTNVLHALFLKVSTYLPGTGLSMLGCILFIIFGQVVYLLFLAYVTGVSLKDWTNLGYTEYEKEARKIRGKLGKESASDVLNGNIKHHSNNWDYYNDLVEQHRSRNT